MQSSVEYINETLRILIGNTTGNMLSFMKSTLWQHTLSSIYTYQHEIRFQILTVMGELCFLTDFEVLSAVSITVIIFGNRVLSMIRLK